MLVGYRALHLIRRRQRSPSLVVLLPDRGSREAKLTQKDVKELFEVCEALEATAGK